LLGFHAYINEMHGSRSKIPIKKSRQAALCGAISFRRQRVTVSTNNLFLTN
jgi:hypothetical protein